MDEQKVTLPLTLVNAIFGYLGTRPYQDVFQIIGALQKEVGEQLKPATSPAAPPQ